MTKYREILRLKSLGFSERNIAQSCGVSRNTVAKVLKKAAEINLSWPLDFDMTDSALEELMFPKDKSATNKRMPNFDYIRKELLRNGVNKKLLWVEYCEECRMSVKVKSFAPRQIQRRLFAALVTLSRKVFRPWHKWF